MVRGGGPIRTLLRLSLGSALGSLTPWLISVATTIWTNNCVPACSGPCQPVPWPRPDTPFDQQKRDDTGLDRTGRDSPGLSDNADVASSILASPTEKFQVGVVVGLKWSDDSPCVPATGCHGLDRTLVRSQFMLGAVAPVQ